jgi:hypothetical protein
MREELEQKIYNDCKLLFPADKEDERIYGFECSDGWFDLISTLCESINRELEYDKELKVSVVQVKEKFGGLRFYTHGGNPKVDGMITLAETLSYRICETCGNKGEIRQDRAWWRTLCDEHNGL